MTTHTHTHTLMNVCCVHYLCRQIQWNDVYHDGGETRVDGQEEILQYQHSGKVINRDQKLKYCKNAHAEYWTIFRYCADGRTGSSPPATNILAELRLTFSFILQFGLNCALGFTYITSNYYNISEHSLHMGSSLNLILTRSRSSSTIHIVSPDILLSDTINIDTSTGTCSQIFTMHNQEK